MKRTQLLIMYGMFCLLFTFGTIAYAHFLIPEQMDESDIPPDLSEITLSGSLLESSYGQNQIKSYYDGNSVVIYFYQNFGYVEIILLNESGGTIYENTVNTAVQQTVYIPISTTTNGILTLVLNNANGYAEGEFNR